MQIGITDPNHKWYDIETVILLKPTIGRFWRFSLRPDGSIELSLNEIIEILRLLNEKFNFHFELLNSSSERSFITFKLSKEDYFKFQLLKNTDGILWVEILGI